MGGKAIRLAVGLCAAGCSGPPSSIFDEGAPPTSDPTAKAVADGSVPPDAFVLFSPDDGPDPKNPYGIRLTDVTALALDDVYLGGAALDDNWGVGAGAAIGDLNGDGAQDLVFARIDDRFSAYPGGPSVLLLNDGPEAGAATGFAHFTPDPLFAAQCEGVIAHGVALGDYDSDGDLDIFIGANGPDRLLRNDGLGHFTDVTALLGVAGLEGDVTVGALWVDLNHDGLLDLYVVQYTNTDPPVVNPGSRNRLYLNVGGGELRDVSAQSGTNHGAPTQAVAAADLSRTGNIDLYLANDGPGDAWYQLASIDGQGVPLFDEVGAAREVYTPRASMGIGVADVDGDLTPDLYISNWGPNVLHLNPTPGGPVVPGGVAFNATAYVDPFGVILVSWGVHFIDLDRDAALELYVANGSIYEALPCDHQLDRYLRQPARGFPFEIITGSVGMPTVPCAAPGDPVGGRGAIFGDLDGDGDDDMVLTPFIERYRIYQNDTPRVNHAVRVRLLGTVSSPDPVGATLRVTRVDGSEIVRFRHGGGDTYSQSDAVLEVGLGDATAVTEARILWPSGLEQRIDGLPGFALDAEVIVVEPSWLEVSPRVVREGNGPAELVYTPVDEAGEPLGAAGAGRTVLATRSDGVAVAFHDLGDGRYTASLPHPGVARRTVLEIRVNGVPLRVRPMISYE